MNCITCAEKEPATGRRECGSCYGKRRRGTLTLGDASFRHRTVSERYDDKGNLKGRSYSYARVPHEMPLLPPAPVRVRVSGRRAPIAGNTILVLPDTQIGYRMRDDETVEAFHDEDALAATLTFARGIGAGRVVLLGDFLDLAPFSRFAAEPGFSGSVVQRAFDRGYEYLCGLRDAVGPDVPIDLIAGNHDERLGKAMRKFAPDAARLRAAGDPDFWPALSVPNLLRLDDLKIGYVEGYPAGRLWLTPTLVAMHGTVVNSSGSTAARIIADSSVSILFGHVHRQELHYRTFAGPDGPVTVFAASPGTLCRGDGAVPSFKSGYSERTGGSIGATENWQQGLALVTDDGGPEPVIEFGRIRNGALTFRGQVWTGYRK